MNYIDQLKIKGILYTLKDPTVADQINARIQELIGTAPANLDTLQELAAAISSGDEAVEGILTTLATKTSKEYVDNLFANIQLTPGPQGETGPQGPKGDTGTFDYSDLADYVTNTALGTKIGNLGTTVPVYSFESYSSNGAVKYGEGTVKPTGETGTDVAEVIVVTNTSTDPNAVEFVGQKFWIADDATIGDTLYQLLDAEGQEVGIAVKITAIDIRDLTVKEYIDALDLKKANTVDVNLALDGKADVQDIEALTTAIQSKADLTLIGELGNKSEAVEATYYTAEEAAAYNTENELQEEDEGYKSEGDLKSAAIEAVPYSTVIEVILDKYQSLLARIETLENA